MNHKKIDVDNNEPVEIKDMKKQGLVSEIICREKIVVIPSKNKKTSYMIFAFQKIYEDYGIDYDTIVVLSYLNELSVFSIRLKVESRKMFLMNYVKLGLIAKDYSVKNKSVYRLTDKALNIINDFNRIIENTDSFIEKNREAELDIDSKVSSALSKYFNN